MESKHTPGPWELDPPEAAHVVSEDYHNIRAGCGFLSPAKEVREPGFSISGHMTPADARLIAAAPDLLALLQTAVSDGHTITWQKKRRELLAKIDGSAL